MSVHHAHPTGRDFVPSSHETRAIATERLVQVLSFQSGQWARLPEVHNARLTFVLPLLGPRAADQEYNVGFSVMYLRKQHLPATMSSRRKGVQP